MKPSIKSAKIENFLDILSNQMYGRKRTDSIKGNICTSCGKPAVEFKDEISKKEYTISGMCQECQDKIFE